MANSYTQHVSTAPPIKTTPLECDHDIVCRIKLNNTLSCLNTIRKYEGQRDRQNCHRIQRALQIAYMAAKAR